MDTIINNEYIEYKNIGYYKAEDRIFKIKNFDLTTNGKTKLETFKTNIWYIISFLNDKSINIDDFENRIFFDYETLKQITGNPRKMINDLLAIKMIIEYDYKSWNELLDRNVYNMGYVINTKRVYCLLCEKGKQEESYLRNNTETTRKIYEYEIIEHLELWHCFKKEYNNNLSFDMDTIINEARQDKMKDYISYVKPEYRFKKHDLEISNIEYYNEKGNSITITLKCKNCDYDRTIHENIGVCRHE